ncbi:hypothetical protein [Pseudomonas mohnii]
MPNQETLIHLANLLNRNQNTLIDYTANLLQKMAGEDISEKRVLAGKVQSHLASIGQLVPESQLPTWFGELKNKSLEYSNGRMKGQDFLSDIIRLLPEIKAHTWLSNDPSTSGFDFESIFSECRVNSRIPELFDELILALERIRDSGTLDSRSMIDALSKLISTMHIGKSSSCFSMDGAWQFLCSFAENVLWNELSKIPLLGSLTDALRQTMEETQVEITKLFKDVQSEMTERVAKEVRPLQHSREIFNLYGKTGSVLKIEHQTQSSTTV